MAIIIAVNHWPSAPWIECFRRLIPEQIVVGENDVINSSAIHFAAVWKHTHGSLKKYNNLQAIFSLGAGVDHILSDPELPNVPIVRSVDFNLTDRMSEWVVMHALCHLRKYNQYKKQQFKCLWLDDRTQLSAKDVNVGIMGLGVFGSDAARKLSMMGFHVSAWCRKARTHTKIPLYYGVEQLPNFLSKTDILVSLLPLTQHTRGLLNLTVFSQLRHSKNFGGPVLINAGRGALQVEQDIVSALDTGILYAATLDVFETEPLPNGSPLWRHPRVNISPHNAAISDLDSIVSNIAGKISAFMKGEPIQHIVNIKQEY
jgi:glyoxylate/hydroxypyruvate reductase A